MPKLDADDYLAVQSYQEALEAHHRVAGIILFELARLELVTRDLVVRNFIARADMMMRAVFRLWDLEDYQDCWILHRCLLDRLFHLHHLDEHDQFEVFEAWSFLEQYKAVNRVRSDPEFPDARESQLFTVTTEQKRRVRELSKNAPVWKRPKAEDVARQLGMGFLYRFGYDAGSRHVHPMANDGLQDFFTITKLEPAPEFPDQRSVLSNTLLVGTMLVREGLNASTLRWRAVVYDLLDDLGQFLATGTEAYKTRCADIAKLIEDDVCLCARQEEPPQGGDAV